MSAVAMYVGMLLDCPRVWVIRVAPGTASSSLFDLGYNVFSLHQPPLDIDGCVADPIGSQMNDRA